MKSRTNQPDVPMAFSIHTRHNAKAKKNPDAREIPMYAVSSAAVQRNHEGRAREECHQIYRTYRLFKLVLRRLGTDFPPSIARPR
jgi:hypothetical protein